MINKQLIKFQFKEKEEYILIYITVYLKESLIVYRIQYNNNITMNIYFSKRKLNEQGTIK